MYIFNDINLFQYFLCSLLLFLLSFLSGCFKGKSLDGIVFYLAFLVLFIFITFRTGLGVDEPTYQVEYNNYTYIYSDFKFEYGFYAIFYLFKMLGVGVDNFNYFFTLLFLCLSFLVVYIVEKEYRSIVILSFIFSAVYIDLIFNAYRQGLAVLFAILMVFYLSKRSIVKFLISAIFAIGFHWSSIIVLFFTLISTFINDKAYKIILWVLIALHLGVVFVKIDIIKYFPIDIFNDIGLPVVSNAVNAYLNIKVDGNSFYDASIIWKIITILPIIGSMIISLFCYNKQTPYAKVFVFTLMYSFIMIGMAYSFRNYYWGLPFFSFMLPKLLENRSQNVKILIYIYLVMFSFVGFYYSSIIPMIYP